MNGIPDPDLICANLAKPGSTFCETCIKYTGPAWQRGTGHYDLNGECGRCRYFCLGVRYEKARYARGKDPFTQEQLCGACTIKDDQRGGGGGAPDFYWDHLTTNIGTADLLDPKRSDSGSLFLWADGFYRNDPEDQNDKTEASDYHFRNMMAARARPPARNGTMWYAVEPMVPSYLTPFVPYKICQEVQGKCTENICEDCAFRPPTVAAHTTLSRFE